MSIDVLEAAQMRNYDPRYTDRAWLAVELGALIERAAWREIGGLLVHVALAVAPIAGPPARVVEAAALPPRSAGHGPSSWADASWITSELALHVAALMDPDGDLQAAALRAAGLVARLEIV